MSNELLELLKSRRSIRSYLPKMIKEEELDAIVEAGTYAPTAMGRQSPIIVAVTNKEIRDELSRMNAEIMQSVMDPYYGAPVIILVFAPREEATHIQDASCVLLNMMLAAHSLHIGTCWRLIGKRKCLIHHVENSSWRNGKLMAVMRVLVLWLLDTVEKKIHVQKREKVITLSKLNKKWKFFHFFLFILSISYHKMAIFSSLYLLSCLWYNIYPREEICYECYRKNEQNTQVVHTDQWGSTGKRILVK